jgi:hypothetical protein
MSHILTWVTQQISCKIKSEPQISDSDSKPENLISPWISLLFFEYPVRHRSTHSPEEDLGVIIWESTIKTKFKSKGKKEHVE